MMRFKLLLFAGLGLAAPVFGTTCSALFGGSDTINQYGGRALWKVDSAELTHHQVIWVTDAVWVANGNTFGSSPNVINVSDASSANNYTLVATIFNAPAGTIIHFRPISSDTTAVSAAGIFTSANACTNLSLTLTTAAEPSEAARHPTPPNKFVPPQNAVTPVTSHNWVEGSDCSNFNDCVNKANAGSPTDGVLLLPTNHNCTTSVYGQGAYGSPTCVLPLPPNVTRFTVVSTATGTLQTTTTMPFTNGQQVVLYSQYGLPAPIQGGTASEASRDPVYTITNISGNTFQLKDYSGTVLSSLSSAWTGSETYIYAWPQFSNSMYHVIDVQRSSNDKLPPPGVRIDVNAYAQSMATLTMNGTSLFNYPGASGWIFRHIIFKPAPSGSVVDPPITHPTISLQSADHIVFDQCGISGTVRPDRAQITWYTNFSSYIAVQNSQLYNLQHWVPIKQSTLTASGSTITESANNNWWQGHDLTLAAPLSATFSGSGQFNVYWDLSGNPTIAPGTGLTVSSAPGWTVLPAASVTAGIYPLDGNARWNVYPMGYGTVTAGAVAITDANTAFGGYYQKGPYVGPSLDDSTNAWNDGHQSTYWTGAGPYTDLNNGWDGVGVVGPFFDSWGINGCNGNGYCNALTQNTRDLWMARNYYALHKSWTIIASQIGSTVAWDHGYSFIRNGSELKAGERVLVDGNTFDTMIVDVTPSGACFGMQNLVLGGGLYDPTKLQWRSTAKVTDFDVRNNTLLNCPVAFVTGGQAFSTNIGGTWAARGWWHNNLITHSTDPTKLATQLYWGGQVRGQLTLFGGSFDQIVEHNTSLGRGGVYPLLGHMNPRPGMGTIWRNNLLDFVPGDGSTVYPDFVLSPEFAYVPAFPGQGPALLTATRSTLSGDVWVPTWTSYNNGNPTPWTSAQLASYVSMYPSATFAPLGSNLAATLAAIKWRNASYTTPCCYLTDFHLRDDSPYVSGSGSRTAFDGLDAGADLTLLERAQGRVLNARAYSLSSGTVTVGWNYEGVGYLNFLDVPDSCSSVDWVTDAQFVADGNAILPAHYVRVAATSNSAEPQSAQLTVPSGTKIHYRVNCPVTQPTGVAIAK